MAEVKNSFAPKNNSTNSYLPHCFSIKPFLLNSLIYPSPSHIFLIHLQIA